MFRLQAHLRSTINGQELRRNQRSVWSSLFCHSSSHSWKLFTTVFAGLYPFLSSSKSSPFDVKSYKLTHKEMGFFKLLGPSLAEKTFFPHLCHSFHIRLACTIQATLLLDFLSTPNICPNSNKLVMARQAHCSGASCPNGSIRLSPHGPLYNYSITKPPKCMVRIHNIRHYQVFSCHLIMQHHTTSKRAYTVVEGKRRSSGTDYFTLF